MPFCTHCGNRIPDDANFCPSCGRQVSSVQRSTAVYNPQKEIREAVHAGERALDSLYAAQAELNKAMSWGFVDMLGGGALTSFILFMAVVVVCVLIKIIIRVFVRKKGEEKM